MKRTFLALLLTFIMLTTLTTVGTVNAVGNNQFSLSDKNDYLSVEEDIVIAGNITSSKKFEEIKEYLDEDHIIFIYNLNGELKDILYDEVITDGIGMIYYYDENGTLHRLKITQENLSKDSMSGHITKQFTKEFKKYTQIKENKLDIGSQTETHFFSSTLSTTSTCDFGNPKIIYGNTHINGEYGYFVTKHDLYRCNTEDKYIFRVESWVKFISGDAAIESSYNSDYKSDKALIKGELKKHVEYGYGAWYSAQPSSLDYWPMSESQPDLNAQWLSQSEGAAWEYTGFNTSPDKAVDVYSGMLIETKLATPYEMRVNGEYHISANFKVRKKRLILGDIVKNIDSNEIIYLDVMI